MATIPNILNPQDSDWKELLNISINDWAIEFRIGPILIGIFFLVLILILFIYRNKILNYFHRYELSEIELNIIHFGKVTIRPNTETIKIAYQTWIEIKTRKVGLPFDGEHDFIIEIYNSWYELFRVLRELTKSIPANLLREDKSTRELVNLMIAVLNEGLRPHLTIWQAKFRRWYDQAAQNNSDKSPQQIQKDYPFYEELVRDLKRINSDMITYADWLEKLVQGSERK